MYFPKIKKTKEQIEVMIQSMLLEYGEQEDEQMAELLSKNYKISKEDALDALRAYENSFDEDYELESNKVEYANI